MFKKMKLKESLPLSQRITFPCVEIESDEVVSENGIECIHRKLKPRAPLPIPDLGNADCYGIAYMQSRGIELQPVQAAPRVSPMEAINIAEKAIDNLHIPQANEN